MEIKGHSFLWDNETFQTLLNNVVKGVPLKAIDKKHLVGAAHGFNSQGFNFFGDVSVFLVCKFIKKNSY